MNYFEPHITTSERIMSFCLSDTRAKIKTFDISHNQQKITGSLELNQFYNVGNNDLTSKFITVQNQRTYKVYTILRSHIDHSVHNEFIKILHN